MSGIARVSEKMKKKISFGDYALSAPEAVQPQMDAIPPVAATTPQPPRKVYALSKEDSKKLQAIFSKRLNTANQTSIAEIMSEAISLLFQREF